jgi:predicted metal-dependent hydrolase
LSGGPYARGIELFNAREFWHAHEAWEEHWLNASGEEKTFLQGLIQLAAAYHHVQRGTFRGGVRLFDAAFAKLEPFADGYANIDRRDAITAAIAHREKIARGDNIEASDFPKLSYN